MGVAWGQIPVVETPGPLLVETTWGAFQQTLNTVEALFHSTQWVLDLTSFESGAMGGEFEEEIQALPDIIAETEAILWDARRLQQDIERLYGLKEVPEGTDGLAKRLQEIRLWQYQRKVRAQQHQQLPARVASLANRIRRWWGRISGVLGDKQIGQQQHEMLQQLAHLEAQSQVVNAAYQQVILTETMEQPLVDEAIPRINAQIYATMPRP